MRFSIFGSREKLNSLGLGGDGDEVDLIREIETSFGIAFEKTDAGSIEDLGEIERIVRSEIAKRSDSHPIWALICRIAREHTGLKGPFDRQTTLFPELAIERMKGGKPDV